MKRTNWRSPSLVVALTFALTVSSGWARQEGQEQGKKAKVELPPAVVEAIRANVPNAEIATAEVEKEGGINLYDIEFKAGRGEIEVAEDGTVMDVATIITMKDLPKAAAATIQKAAAGATIKQVEKSEVRAEIKKVGGKGAIVKRGSPKYIYEAELAKDDQRGEIQVAADGRVIEKPEWRAEKTKEKEQIAEKEEAEEQEEKEEAEEGKPTAPVLDLKILPPAVLNAFKAAYPNAAIKGTSKETEKGVTYYEVESVDGKLNRDLLYTPDGKAVEIEESVAPSAIPTAVLQALDKAHPGYKILKAEDLTKDGQKFFELHIQVKDKKMGVTIDPTGKIIK